MDEADRLAAQLAETLAQLHAQLTPLIEAVAGHRAALETAGFSPTAAEAMAVAFHAALMQHIANARQPGS